MSKFALNLIKIKFDIVKKPLIKKQKNLQISKN